MHNRFIFFILFFFTSIAAGFLLQRFFPLQQSRSTSSRINPERAGTNVPEWQAALNEEQYRILVEKGTERPFSSPLNDEKRSGIYVSADCNEPVFRSEQKFDSGTGWPSFWAPVNPDAVVTQEDYHPLLGSRVEVLSKCGGHLGHVFDDGPPPTGLRYCINGAALRFVPDADEKLK